MKQSITEEEVYDFLLNDKTFQTAFTITMAFNITRGGYDRTAATALEIMRHCDNLVGRGIVDCVNRDNANFYKALTPHEIAQRKLGK